MSKVVVLFIGFSWVSSFNLGCGYRFIVLNVLGLSRGDIRLGWCQVFRYGYVCYILRDQLQRKLKQFFNRSYNLYYLLFLVKIQRWLYGLGKRIFDFYSQKIMIICGMYLYKLFGLVFLVIIVLIFNWFLVYLYFLFLFMLIFKIYFSQKFFFFIKVFKVMVIEVCFIYI